VTRITGDEERSGTVLPFEEAGLGRTLGHHLVQPCQSAATGEEASPIPRGHFFIGGPIAERAAVPKKDKTARSVSVGMMNPCRIYRWSATSLIGAPDVEPGL